MEGLHGPRNFLTEGILNVYMMVALSPKGANYEINSFISLSSWELSSKVFQISSERWFMNTENQIISAVKSREMTSRKVHSLGGQLNAFLVNV